jgi:hypothetical protein
LTTSLDIEPVSDIEIRERRFFFRFSIALTVTVLIGFGSFIAIGISSFDSPWWVHLHAVSFMSWITLYVVQSLLVLRNTVKPHRQLGMIGAALAVWMVLVGLTLTPVTIAADRMPPFFTPTVFLALDWVNVILFGILVAAALYLRRQTDWHRRLMLCATICVVAPALGRLLALADAATPSNNVALLLIYVAVAMIADRRIRGRVHPAYFWGGGTILAMAPAVALLGALPAFQQFAMSFQG